jgi:hypothetical protein
MDTPKSTYSDLGVVDDFTMRALITQQADDLYDYAAPRIMPRSPATISV